MSESWPEQSMYFGLAIQVSDRATQQLHAATLYRFDGRLKIGDIQNHLTSRCADARASASLFWIAPDLSQEDQQILAATVDAWLEDNAGKIPYSVAHPGGVIFKDNVWVGNEPGQGLTCATFIVALFDELGIPFIEIGTWQARSDDTAWAHRILAMLSPLMSSEHVSAQRGRIGDTTRVRPADVAAAGLLIHQQRESPLEFEEVAPLSERIEAALLA